MYIRKGKIEDYDRIMDLYRDARIYMAEVGNPNQWRDSWPPDDLIMEDIKAGMNYVCVKDEVVVGTFYLMKSPDPTYLKIYDGEWINDHDYVVVHRITTDRNVKGAGRFILDWVYEAFGETRIDTHKDNIPMQGLVNSCGFKYCGIIFLENGEERIAFQRV